MKDETKNWLTYATENLRSAAILLKSDLFNPCLQNIQQSIEKYLKALMLENNQKFRKTHSISELNSLLEKDDIHIGLTEEECELLDTVYLPSKYPLGSVLPDFEPDFNLCNECLKIAGHVEQKVQAIISAQSCNKKG
ncbi:HEPN domain-containing protein [Desulfobacula sp.]|uniref:HEPN domain-containing protein n=1 Tax=Desulfobacula sp. TaxID=2593537 RepID=UPI00262771E8|nr:HEPN domain-containing protein [Desulfobacula sp.]